MQRNRQLKAENIFRQALYCEEVGDIEGALKLHLAAANLGLPAAQCSLGTLYDDVIKPSNPKKAVSWYKKAVRNGDAVAAYNLAIHYRNLNNTRWYHYWIRKAADLGDEDAIKACKAR